MCMITAEQETGTLALPKEPDENCMLCDSAAYLKRTVSGAYGKKGGQEQFSATLVPCFGQRLCLSLQCVIELAHGILLHRR